MTKTCKNCKHLNRELAFCRACGAKWINDNSGAYCKYFEKLTPPTKGDVIRQGGNRALAVFQQQNTCWLCVYSNKSKSHNDICHCPADKTCTDGIEAWLNAPADCVKQNGNDDTQTDLCKADNTESEGEDE